MKNILLTDFIQPPALIENKIFGKEFKLIVANATNYMDISDETWKKADAILTFHLIKYDRKLLSKLKSCKIICRIGVGVDHIDTKAAKEFGIKICNVPDYGVDEVADHTMALLLSLTRGLKEYIRKVEKRDWSKENNLPIRIQNKTLGIIGLGRIGTAVAIRAKAFGLKVIFYDPYVANGIEKSLGLHRTRSLIEIAKESNFISLHIPLNNETNNIVDDNFFLNMKKDSCIINTARGSLIDLKSLEKNMRNNKIKAAALDVLPNEPNNDEQSLVVSLENNEEWISNRLIITPHIAFYSPESFIEIRTKAANEVKRVLKGEKPFNLI